jgi:hypothetical protein
VLCQFLTIHVHVHIVFILLLSYLFSFAYIYLIFSLAIQYQLLLFCCRYLVVPVYMWDSARSLQDARCVHCRGQHIASRLYATDMWNNGHTERHSPRVLFGINTRFYLVSRIYRCRYNHRVSTSHPSVLELLQPIEQPFILLHRSGFTRQLLNFINNFADNGLSFTKIQQLVRKNYLTTNAHRRGIFRIDAATFDGEGIYRWPVCENKDVFPTNHLLSQVFLSYFFLKENSFNIALQNVESGEWISANHTFKVAANIGYERSDRRWTSIYDSVFIILNSKGHIMKWKFTKGASFDEIIQCYKDIATRNEKKQKANPEIYVDNCCHVRQKLQDAFSDKELVVKLDIFHAVQRLTSKIPKHKYRARISKYLTKNATKTPYLVHLNRTYLGVRTFSSVQADPVW